MGVGSRPIDMHDETILVVIATALSKSEGVYYAWSPQLRCIRDGKTAEEAIAMCKEALEVLFESLIERNTLSSYLESHGYISFRLSEECHLYDRNVAIAMGLEEPCLDTIAQHRVSVGSLARV